MGRRRALLDDSDDHSGNTFVNHQVHEEGSNHVEVSGKGNDYMEGSGYS